MHFSPLTCQFSWFVCSIVYEIKERTNNCLARCSALHRTTQNVGQRFPLPTLYLFFCLQCLLKDFSQLRPVHYCPSHGWVNHNHMYHPYPKQLYNFNLKEVVAAFCPPSSGLKFRHCSSSADLCEMCEKIQYCLLARCMAVAQVCDTRFATLLLKSFRCIFLSFKHAHRPESTCKMMAQTLDENRQVHAAWNRAQWTVCLRRW